MTEKELLYVEDALGHVDIMKKCCSGTVQQITDKGLQNFVQELIKDTDALYGRFYGLL